MLSDAQLREIMPRLPAARLPTLLPHLNSAMAEYAIDTPARAAAFVAQLAHESGEFRWMEEIWGPTDAQRRYDPPSTLAARLGNTQPGDGHRFKGRGPIQLTGRANYQRFGQLLGIDLVAAPERAASPEVAFRIAALFWANRGLNRLADAGDFREITRRINGGFNGLADRMKYFERARTVLAEAISKALPRRRGAVLAPVPEEELSRGVEAIREFRKSTRRKTKVGRKAAGKTARKTRARKPSVKKKRPGKKAAAKKASAGKASKRKAPAKKAAARKSAARKAPARKKTGKKRTAASATRRRTGTRR